MQRYNWPGNIRQLENMIRSYVLIGNEEALVADLVSHQFGQPDPRNRSRQAGFAEGDYQGRYPRDLEREISSKCFRPNGWSRLKDRQMVEQNDRSLLYKLQESHVRGLPGRPPKRK